MYCLIIAITSARQLMPNCAAYAGISQSVDTRPQRRRALDLCAFLHPPCAERDQPGIWARANQSNHAVARNSMPPVAILAPTLRVPESTAGKLHGRGPARPAITRNVEIQLGWSIEAARRKCRPPERWDVASFDASS